MPLLFPLPDPHQSYQDALFVGREIALQELSDWLQQQEKRLFVLVAPPAMGKTWLLKRFSTEFKAHLPIFWLNIPIRDANSTQNDLNINDLGNILKDFVKDVSETNLAVSYDPLMDVSLMAEVVARNIGEQCGPGKTIFVVVDQVDQLSERAWELLETRLVQPLASHPRLHFLVALRKNQRLSAPTLRRSEKRLDLEPLLFTQERQEAREQIDKLAQVEEISEVVRAEIWHLIEDYVTVYPGLNTFLFYHANQNITAGKTSLDEDFWQQALQKLVDLPLDGSGQLTPSSLCLLVRLLEVVKSLSRTWTIDLLGKELGLTPAKAFQWLNELQTYWFVVFDNSQGQYHIVDGLYEFLQIISAQSLVDLFLQQERMQCL